MGLAYGNANKLPFPQFTNAWKIERIQNRSTRSGIGQEGFFLIKNPVGHLSTPGIAVLNSLYHFFRGLLDLEDLVFAHVF